MHPCNWPSWHPVAMSATKSFFSQPITYLERSQYKQPETHPCYSIEATFRDMPATTWGGGGCELCTLGHILLELALPASILNMHVLPSPLFFSSSGWSSKELLLELEICKRRCSSCPTALEACGHLAGASTGDESGWQGHQHRDVILIEKLATCLPHRLACLKTQMDLHARLSRDQQRVRQMPPNSTIAHVSGVSNTSPSFLPLPSPPAHLLTCGQGGGQAIRLMLTTVLEK